MKFFFLLILLKVPLLAMENQDTVLDQILKEEAKNYRRLLEKLPQLSKEQKIANTLAALTKLIQDRLQNKISLDLGIRVPIWGPNPLSIASEYDQLISVTKELLRYGADPNAVGNNFWPEAIPLAQAVEAGAVKTARLLLKAGANPCKYKKLLHNACNKAINETKSMKKWVQIIKLLLKNGADSNLKTDMGYTPLFTITGSGRNPFGAKVLPIVKLLLAYGADINVYDSALIPYAEKHNPNAAQFLKDYRDKKIKLKKKKLR